MEMQYQQPSTQSLYRPPAQAAPAQTRQSSPEHTPVQLKAQAPVVQTSARMGGAAVTPMSAAAAPVQGSRYDRKAARQSKKLPEGKMNIHRILQDSTMADMFEQAAKEHSFDEGARYGRAYQAYKAAPSEEAANALTNTLSLDSEGGGLPDPESAAGSDEPSKLYANSRQVNAYKEGLANTRDHSQADNPFSYAANRIYSGILPELDSIREELEGPAIIKGQKNPFEARQRYEMLKRYNMLTRLDRKKAAKR